MATSKTTRQSTAGRKSTKKTAPRKGSGKAPARKRNRWAARRNTGLVCFVLAVFSAFGYFGVSALLIDLLVGLERGLLGYGYLVAPVMLLWSSIILIFHGGMPVRLRTGAALSFPVVIGALADAFLNNDPGEYPFGLLVRNLWAQGQEMRSGGVLGGMLAHVLVLTVSRAGAVLVLLVMMAVCVMILTRTTPTDLLRWVNDARARRRQRRKEREEEWQEDWQQEAAENQTQESLPAPEQSRVGLPLFGRRRQQSIDLPVDGQEETAPAEQPPAPKPKRSPVPLKKAKTKIIVEGENVPAPPSVQEPEPPAWDPSLPESETGESFFRSMIGQKGKKKSVSPSPPPPAPMVAPEAERPAPAPDAGKEKRELRAAAEEVAKELDQELDQELNRKVEYVRPPLELLTEPGKAREDARKEIAEVTERLDDTFEAFGIDAHVVGEIRGPTVTQYELSMGRGVKLSRVTGMADDITVSLGVEKVRIAPIPGKSQVVGVEIPNRKATPVPIRDVLSSSTFQQHKSNVAFALGKDIAGNVVVGNIAKLPHMLIAGTTGSGKSVCTNSIVISLLYRSSPDDVRLIMIDPKIVEFEGYNGIPHLLIPVVTDPKKAAGALQWAVTEMLKRYRTFAEWHVRDLDSYNSMVRTAPDTAEEPMPRIVVIIDELADLMLVASKEVEESICRLAQMGRAAGMHLIIATQRPSSDVITGLMKANIPSRIALTVSSGMESRIILDTQGAEKLLGNGDMLYNPVGAKRPTRVQGCFISDKEVADVIEFVKSNSESDYDDDIIQEVEQNAENAGKNGKKGGSTLPSLPDSTFDSTTPPASTGADEDPMMSAAIDVVVETGMASVSSLQRKLKLGYSRAARLVDQMEELGVVGPFEGSKPRKVLMTKEQWNERKMQGGKLTDLDQAKAMSEAADREELLSEEVDMPPFEVD